MNKRSNLNLNTVSTCIAVMGITSFMIFFPELSEAATNAFDVNVKGDAEMKTAFNTIKNLITGYAGKAITIVALFFAICASLLKFNMVAFTSTVGVALAISVGPSFIENVVGTTF